jgi:hypothetical protein
MDAPLDPGRPVADPAKVTRRRAPRWLVEVTAWSLGLVLTAGVVVSQSVQPQEELVTEQATPAFREPQREPLVLTKPSPSPVPQPKPAPPARAAANPDLDVESVLGPPPGPQHDPRPAKVAAPADRYAFLVGVQDYRRPTVDTIGSVKDVQYIRSMLLASGWQADNIRVITDGQATGQAIRNGMAWLAEKGRPGTFSLFHYSGHVKQHGGVDDSLWPVDRDFVRDTQVAAALNKVQGRLWVDIAGCEGASFMDGLPSDRVLFSGSSKAIEKSYEYPPWGMSVWTGLVFDLGLRQGQADADGDGRTTIGEALRYSQYYAQAITLGQRPHGRQTPQFAGAPDLGWTLADPPA